MDTDESIVAINEHHLERECLRIPSDVLRWATEAVNARRDVDAIKADLEVIEADTCRQIRDTPGKFGLEKITDKAVESTCSLQKAVRAKLAELQAAKHRADMANAVLSALEHKKRSLTLLVDLHGMGYFANVKPTREGSEAVKAMAASRIKPIRPRDEE